MALDYGDRPMKIKEDCLGCKKGFLIVIEIEQEPKPYIL
jgi:hypothetical protein